MRIVFRRWWHGALRLADCSFPEQGLRMGRLEPPARPWRTQRGRPMSMPTPGDAAAAAPPSSRVVSRAFTTALLGTTPVQGDAAGRPETLFLERLEQAARAQDGTVHVPRLPSVLPRLLKLLGKDEVGSREVADLLRREPALLGRVMHIVNSARYRGDAPVASLEAAIALLGHRGIHEVVSQAVMAPVFSPGKGRFGQTAGRLLWDQAERCAHACAFLRAGVADPFEAYLAGMAANVGLIVALRLLDRHHPADAFTSLGFHDKLAEHGTRLSACIARQWGFPETIPRAIEAMADGVDSSDAHGLGATLARADRASKMHVLRAAEGRTPAAFGCECDDDTCRIELDRVFGSASCEAAQYPAPMDAGITVRPC